MKQPKLKLIDGGAREPSPPERPERPKGIGRPEYIVLFAIAGIVWCTIGYWIWKLAFH